MATVTLSVRDSRTGREIDLPSGYTLVRRTTEGDTPITPSREREGRYRADLPTGQRERFAVLLTNGDEGWGASTVAAALTFTCSLTVEQGGPRTR